MLLTGDDLVEPAVEFSEAGAQLVHQAIEPLVELVEPAGGQHTDAVDRDAFRFPVCAASRHRDVLRGSALRRSPTRAERELQSGNFVITDRTDGVCTNTGSERSYVLVRYRTSAHRWFGESSRQANQET
ncbi:hypothetical protein ACVGOW_19560 [Pseudonocardia saturnea]